MEIIKDGIIFVLLGLILLLNSKFWKHNLKEEFMAGLKLKGFIGGIALIIIGVLIIIKG